MGRGIGHLLLLAAIAVLLLQVNCRPEKPRKPEKGIWKSVLNEARRREKREQKTLRRRLKSGIDRKVTSFTELEPGILEANTRPLGTLAEEIGEPSRIINWIGTIARKKYDTDDIPKILKGLKLTCPFVKPECDINKEYRSVDGTCNNLRNPLWGAAFTPMARRLDAQYDKGYIGGYWRDDLPRQTGKYAKLPSAREVSNLVHSALPENPSSALASMAFTFMGQYLAHDVTSTAFERGTEDSLLGCDCTQSVRGCAGIKIPEEDFFRNFSRSCLGLARAKEVTSLNCEGRREQLNMMSSFVDTGNLYGQNDDILATLRGENGKMKTSRSDFLPESPHPNIVARDQNINFLTSGDERVSEVIGLSWITNTMLRLHNNISDELATFNRFSEMSDANKRSNAIFNEARKITIAINQHIIYNEFLSLAIGPAAMEKHKLKSNKKGYLKGYDSKINPTMENELITAGLRLGHSVLRSKLSILNETFSNIQDPLQLRDIFWRPNFFLLLEKGFRQGVVTDRAEVCDRFISDEVRNHLFQTEHGNGEDLMARNIQRGRDHGVPPYNAVRASLGLTTASTFTAGLPDGFEHMNNDAVERLDQAYGDPDDVDLIVGGLCEIPVAGGVVGPTFAEHIGDQFKKLKFGDRFWYENKKNGFTRAQLRQIRKVSLARLICDSMDGVSSIQPQAMRLRDNSGNDLKPCSAIPKVDLSKWK